MRKTKLITGYVFLIPGFCFFAFAILIPFVMGVDIAFTDWNGITETYNYIGLQNFIDIIHDQRVRQPFINTLIFAVLGTVGNTVVSLGLALLVNKKKYFLTTLGKMMFFVPVCFSAVLTSFLWKFIYREVFRELLGIKNVLGMPKLVIPAIVLMGLWNTCGINMLVYLAGLKSIPQDLYEAAVIDGAGSCGLFRYVTVPMLMPSFTVCVTIALTTWFKEFAMVMCATNGGPSGASRTVSLYIYENLYKYSKAGYGQAISLLFVIMMIIAGNLVSGFFRSREIEA